MTKPASSSPRWKPSAGMVAAACVVVGCSLVVSAVYVIAGLGWALLSAGAPFLLFGAILVRGIFRAE